MAEQEACASAVTEALAAASPAATDGNEARGESLLLPLLQGLLGGGGERLLAGLGAAGADVVADVRRSLARLRAALAPPAAHPQARALLTLAERLEDALDAADRLDGCKRRHRRRSRAARHTVGVTHEELAAARRLVDSEDLALAAPAAPATPPSGSGSVSGSASTPSAERTPTPERRPSVDEEVSYHAAVPARQKRPPVAHSASVEAAPVSRDARVVERRAPAPPRPEFHRHSVADAPHAPEPAPAPEPAQIQSRGYPATRSGIAAIANKFNAQIEREAPPPRRAPARHQAPAAPAVAAPTLVARPAPGPGREDASRAPLYKPPPPTYNFAAPPPVADDLSKPLNRFGGNRRLRMKRANTIDIGKPLGGYRRDGDESPGGAPLVPEFRPQTENDRKFLAFMRRNEEIDDGVANGHANWSNRFGNIKNAFENREREDRSRSSSSSSAKRFWRAAEEAPPAQPRGPRRVLAEFNGDRPRVPWAAERRDFSPQGSHPQPLDHYPPAPLHPPPSHHHPSATHHPPAPHHLPAPQHPPAPVQPPKSVHHPPIPQSPTKPIARPFAAKPIPVNQFSHAPMSAFKPLRKITSPTSTAPLFWSPPSAAPAPSPPAEAPYYPTSPAPIAPSPPAGAPWAQATDRPRRVLGLVANKFESDVPPRAAVPSPHRERPLGYGPPTPPTAYAPRPSTRPVGALPSQNDLAAPGLVSRVDPGRDPLEVDAQRLQIEFYEKRIREKKHRGPPNGHYEPPPPPGAYTVTDYTPHDVVSTFVPLQQTPDIEKARAHKVDYLPDVVMNEAPPSASPAPSGKPRTPHRAPLASSPARHDGTNGHAADEETVEHCSVVTRVMRGPVGQSATITAGARTRHDPRPRHSVASTAAAADGLRGALDRASAPRREARTQVLPAPPARTGPPPSAAYAPSPRPPVIEYESLSPRSPASTAESPASRGSSPGGALARSGSWQQLAERRSPSSPRRVVARAKSMHLLAVPKMFEGGIAREELTDKKRTVEAYFSGRVTSGGGAASKARARSRQSAPGYGLGRSRTMPTVSELQFLDESNADDAFEDLVSALA